MPQEPCFRVIATTLNVRQAPLITAPVIGYLHANDVVERLNISSDGYWYEILEGALQGWAAQKYLQLILQPAPAERYPWMAIALAEVGVREFPGNAENPRIVGYLQSTTLRPPDNSKDETLWCSAFVNWCIERAGYEGTDSALARSWLTWGNEISTPERGCIAVLERDQDPRCGHVGFYLDENQQRIALLGGNQSNAVGISWYNYADCLSFRLPG